MYSNVFTLPACQPEFIQQKHLMLLSFFQVKHCEQELHIPENKVSILFTYMAATSLIGRNLFCKLGDFRYFNSFHLYQGGMSTCGLCVLCLPIARSFSSIVAIFIVFGLMEGSMNGQWSLLILETSGKQKLNQAWAYATLLTAVSSCLGSPMAGETNILIL